MTETKPVIRGCVGDPMINILDAAAAVERTFEKALWPVDLSVPQYRILDALEAVDGMQPGHIAALLFQQSHSASGILNRLESRKLVERRYGDPEDRRRVTCHLTAQGRHVLLEARVIYNELADAFVKAAPIAVGDRDVCLEALLVATAFASPLAYSPEKRAEAIEMVRRG